MRRRLDGAKWEKFLSSGLSSFLTSPRYLELASSPIRRNDGYHTASTPAQSRQSPEEDRRDMQTTGEASSWTLPREVMGLPPTLSPRPQTERVANGQSPRSKSVMFQMCIVGQHEQNLAPNTNRTWLRRALILPSYLYNLQLLCPLTACSEVRPSKLPPPEDPTKKKSCSFFMELEPHNPLQFLFRTHINTSHSFIVWI